eukprot:5101451-Prymnesium_polylepis.2
MKYEAPIAPATGSMAQTLTLCVAAAPMPPYHAAAGSKSAETTSTPRAGATFEAMVPSDACRWTIVMTSTPMRCETIAASRFPI